MEKTYCLLDLLELFFRRSQGHELVRTFDFDGSGLGWRTVSDPLQGTKTNNSVKKGGSKRFEIKFF